MADTPLDTIPTKTDIDTPPEAPVSESGPQEEIGGPKGAEPTRFGDWERNGRCSDF